jgi:hypothetical protein
MSVEERRLSDVVEPPAWRTFEDAKFEHRDPDGRVRPERRFEDARDGAR